MSIEPPIKGQCWRHVKRGSSYEIVGVATGQGGHQEGEALVVYRCMETTRLWVRSLDEFKDGRFVRQQREDVGAVLLRVLRNPPESD